jgi:hypothetical protein
MKKQKEKPEFAKDALTTTIQNLPEKFIYNTFIPAEASNADRQLFMEWFAKDYVAENAETNNIVIVLKVPKSYIKRHKHETPHRRYFKHRTACPSPVSCVWPYTGPCVFAARCDRRAHCRRGHGDIPA